MNGPRRHEGHEIDEQDAGWRSQRQGHVHKVVNANCVVKRLQVDHGGGYVHTAFCGSLSHGTPNQGVVESGRSFDCLVPRDSTLSAPYLARGVRTIIWRRHKGLSVLSALGLSIIDVPNNCHGQVPACSIWLRMSVSSWRPQSARARRSARPSMSCPLPVRLRGARRAVSSMDSVMIGSGFSSCGAWCRDCGPPKSDQNWRLEARIWAGGGVCPRTRACKRLLPFSACCRTQSSMLLCASEVALERRCWVRSAASRYVHHSTGELTEKMSERRLDHKAPCSGFMLSVWETACERARRAAKAACCCWLPSLRWAQVR